MRVAVVIVLENNICFVCGSTAIPTKSQIVGQGFKEDLCIDCSLSTNLSPVEIRNCKTFRLHYWSAYNLLVLIKGHKDLISCLNSNRLNTLITKENRSRIHKARSNKIQ